MPSAQKRCPMCHSPRKRFTPPLSQKLHWIVFPVSRCARPCPSQGSCTLASTLSGTCKGACERACPGAQGRCPTGKPGIRLQGGSGSWA